VGKIARHHADDSAESRNFAHAVSQQIWPRGQRAVRRAALFDAAVLARCPPYEIARVIRISKNADPRADAHDY
jgi:hypothetical protein